MRASSIGHLTGVQLPYSIHLIGVRLGQACGSHRTHMLEPESQGFMSHIQLEPVLKTSFPPSID
jgi:hypothetical protein